MRRTVKVVGEEAEIEEYASRLRFLREQFDLTQDQVAERLTMLARAEEETAANINSKMVSTWERGRKKPCKEYRQLLCRLYGVTEEQLGFYGALDQPESVRAKLSKPLISHCRHVHHPERPRMTLVGGFAGSGKTEFSHILSRLSGSACIDKDTISRPLAESLLIALGADPNDRHTETYVRQVRPQEYRSLLSTAQINLECGISTIASAPFLLEFKDESWMRRMKTFCEDRGADLSVVWVDCDEDTMRYNLQNRDAARDGWKLSCWSDYVKSIDLSMRPRGEHLIVDNSRRAKSEIQAQAHKLISFWT